MVFGVGLGVALGVDFEVGLGVGFGVGLGLLAHSALYKRFACFASMALNPLRWPIVTPDFLATIVGFPFLLKAVLL